MVRLYLRTLRSKTLYISLSVGVGILLLFVSLMPHAYIERSGYPQISKYFDMMNHFLGFLLFNFFLFSAILTIRDRLVTHKVLLIYFMIAISWGLLCEGVQLFDETRSFQLIDVLANTTPTMFMFGLYLVLRKRIESEVLIEVPRD